MLQLSEKMLIFVPSFGKRRRHRGERLSFDPPENLQNSKYKGEKSESCFSCSSIYTALSCVELARIYVYVEEMNAKGNLTDEEWKEVWSAMLQTNRYLRAIGAPESEMYDI